ncbi:MULTISPECIES: hypothetical protein [Tenacibaculum]|uniref:Uncharacterized protein n=1 Tax=Tenacibaculum mesophilum TaxID=104268 RepID=A0AAE9MIU6_9FLAO|nr:MULTISPECIES: hypothetical protein [Tenacibaculum]RSC93857.1 hypothetical protein EI424_07580 [Tenacibaculum singaporense]UTD13972.1 hypothetical protein HER15_00100 [Tenacibaculum mesophilum]
MKKEILNLKGVTLLTKGYQKDIKGGLSYPTDGGDGGLCPESNCSSDSQCPQFGSYCKSVGSGDCYWKECSH